MLLRELLQLLNVFGPLFFGKGGDTAEGGPPSLSILLLETCSFVFSRLCHCCVAGLLRESLSRILGWKLWSLEIREGDLVAHEAQMLRQNAIEVSNLLGREHCKLEQDQEQVHDAQDCLRQLC